MASAILSSKSSNRSRRLCVEDAAGAGKIRGDPRNLIEENLRMKICKTRYWKSMRFDFTIKTLVDRAMKLDHIGGTFGSMAEPTPFICLLLKMITIQPDKETVVKFIQNDDYKYVRALGAFYLRLTASDVDVYNYLEPLYSNDYRKLKCILSDGTVMTHMDEFVDQLVRQQDMFGITLPRISESKVLADKKRPMMTDGPTTSYRPFGLENPEDKVLHDMIELTPSEFEIGNANMLRASLGLKPLPLKES